MISKKLLLIDDSKVSQARFKTLFTNAGYEIIIANNGENGIELAKKNVPDLILLDLYMPNRDGIEITKLIQQDFDLNTIPIVILTGSDSISDREKCFNVGVIEVIEKNHDDNFILSYINGLFKSYEKSNLNISFDNILVVEDSILITNIIKYLLTKNGYSAIFVNNGSDCLKILQHEPIDLVLLDIMLPEINGFEVLERIKHINIKNKPSIIIVSHISEKSKINYCLNNGANDFITKPFDQDDLITRVKNNLRLVNLQKELLERTEILEENQESLLAQYKYFPLPTFTWKKSNDDFILNDFNFAAERYTEGKLRDFIGGSLKNYYKKNEGIIADINECFINKSTIFRNMDYTLLSTNQLKSVIAHYVYIPPDKVMVHIEDITNQKNFEQALKNNQELYKSFLEDQTELICNISLNGNITFANDAFCSFFKKDPEKIIGTNYFSFLSFEEKQDAIKYIHMLGIQNKVGTIEHKYELETGEIKWIQWVDTMIFDEFGKFIEFHSIGRDITSHKIADIALQESEIRIRTILNSVTEGIISINASGVINSFNSGACKLFSCLEENIIGKNILSLIPDLFELADVENISKLFSQINGSIIEKTGVKADGSTFSLELSVSDYIAENIKSYLIVIRDVSERKLLEESIKLSATVFEKSDEGIIITDANSKIISVNPAFSKITGYNIEEALGKKPNILKSNRHKPEFYENLWAELLTKHQWKGEIWNRRKNGEIYPQWTSIAAVVDSNDSITKYFAIFYDITGRKQWEENIKHKAYHDALTGLPNRELFYDRLLYSIIQNNTCHSLIAVLFLDLDGFKAVNDSFGHNVGDSVLQEMAKRIQNSVRNIDTVARFGGDEFTVFLSNLKIKEDAEKVGNKIVDAVKQPFLVDDITIHLTTSVGISIFPNDSQNVDELIKEADTALYSAKNSGKNQIQLFENIKCSIV